ncbi:uncharacterized protein AruCF_1714 [Achromobacter ruhlandii]|nr:uncharacterized protein AruCF_1714 [Achromobacter ruhlandii]
MTARRRDIGRSRMNAARPSGHAAFQHPDASRSSGASRST